MLEAPCTELGSHLLGLRALEGRQEPDHRCIGRPHQGASDMWVGIQVEARHAVAEGHVEVAEYLRYPLRVPSNHLGMEVAGSHAPIFQNPHLEEAEAGGLRSCGSIRGDRSSW